MDVDNGFGCHETLSDSELVGQIREGNEEAFGCLCGRYLPVCRSLARRYAGGALEPEDLAQEGMLGFIEATRRFDSRKQVPFELYAKRCIASKMLSALGAQSAHKRRANLGSVPLCEEQADTVGYAPSPDDLVIERETVLFRSEQITTLLSHSENEALRLYLRGCSYAQIAALCGIPPKSVDNALQRVRRKIRTVL